MHFTKQDLEEMILCLDVREVTTRVFAHKLLISQKTFGQNSSFEVKVPITKEE